MKISAPHVAKFDRWSPAQITRGAVSYWYDFGDQSTLFTDTAFTSPVSATADAIAAVRDKSGNNINLTQSTAANRPTWTLQSGVYGALFDGVNDNLLQTGTDLTANQSAWGVMIHVYPASVAGPRTAVYESTGTNATTSRVNLAIFSGGPTGWGIRGRRSDADAGVNVTTGVTPSVNTIQTVGLVWDTSTTTASIYVDGALLTSSALQAAGLFSNTTPLQRSIGFGVSDYFSGVIYEVFAMRGMNVTTIQLADAYFKRKAGR